MEYICINDKYYEDTEEMREICLYIAQLDRQLIFYKSAYEKKLKTIERLSEKVKHYQTLTHVYKVEMNRCARKLTRIYKTIEKDEVVKYFKEL